MIRCFLTLLFDHIFRFCATSVCHKTTFCQATVREIPSDAPKLLRKKSKPQVPSHVYKREDFYHFRARFPENHNDRFSPEIRLSLRTPYRMKALELAGTLYAEFQRLLDDWIIIQVCGRNYCQSHCAKTL
jgi:hypothetical protein